MAEPLRRNSPDADLGGYIRIALLIDLAPRKLGSLEDWLLAFAREGRSRGHVVDVYGKVPTHPVFLERLRAHGAGWGTLDRAGIGSSMWHAVRKLRTYDVLHLQLFQPYRWWTYLAALAWPARVLILDQYSGPLPGQLSWKNAVKNRFRCTAALLRVDGVAGVSNYVVRRDRWLYGLPRRKLRRIYSGVDLQRFTPGSVDGRSPAHVLCVANLHWIKGVEHLVRAVALLGDTEVELTLAGDGPEEAKLQGLVAELGIGRKVHFLGLRNDVSELVRQAGIFVHPAVWEEAFGFAIAEAMAGGCAVVATNAGGIPELIEDGVTGLLVPPADPIAIAGAIRRLLDDPALRDRLQAAGRQRVEERFDLRQSVLANLDWCEESARD